MSISIELKPEVEERLEREASAKGVSVEVYVEDLIERQVSRPSEGASNVDMEEVDRVLDALSEGSEGCPVPPPETYTRESIYLELNCCATSPSLTSCSGCSNVTIHTTARFAKPSELSWHAAMSCAARLRTSSSFGTSVRGRRRRGEASASPQQRQTAASG